MPPLSVSGGHLAVVCLGCCAACTGEMRGSPPLGVPDLTDTLAAPATMPTRISTCSSSGSKPWAWATLPLGFLTRYELSLMPISTPVSLRRKCPLPLFGPRSDMSTVITPLVPYMYGVRALRSTGLPVNSCFLEMGRADLLLGRMLRISAAYMRASSSGVLLPSFLFFAFAIISSAMRESTSLMASAGATPSW